MKNLAIIGGTSLKESDLFRKYKAINKKNKYGKVTIFTNSRTFYIQRHHGNTPPHSINYRAYIQALSDLKVNRIISVNSTGSLKKNIKTPSILIPDDFVSLWNVPTFFDNEIMHVCPTFCESLRTVILNTARRIDPRTYRQGTYIQTTGPRFETPAEIRLLANYGDIIGMTLGSEITLANEKNIEFASICTVDNFANGLGGPISHESVVQGARENKIKLEEIISSILKKYLN